jgi:hypothetical protein
MMKSPFPGMDPYLERHWLDVHQALVTYARDALQPHLPDDLRARMQERVYIESEESIREIFYPDVRIVERAPRPTPPATLSAGGAAVVALAEPEIIDLDVQVEPLREAYIEIIDIGSGNRVVTVIEFISPTNKLAGEGRDNYLKKQRDVLAAGASLVEIDLTRRGPREALLPVQRIHTRRRTTYQIWVRRGWRQTKLEYYRAPLNERLPGIRVPLRETDEDVRLDLQELLDQAYVNGRYDDLDYRNRLEPPLAEDEDAWVDELLRAAGVR